MEDMFTAPSVLFWSGQSASHYSHPGRRFESALNTWEATPAALPSSRPRKSTSPVLPYSLVTPTLDFLPGSVRLLT